MLKIPILTYHSARGHELVYATNDHVALEEDLQTIRRLGFAVVPLRAIVGFLRSEIDLAEDLKLVGLSFDDGANWDWYDFDLPGAPFLKGMRRILDEAGAHADAKWPPPRAVSFVIASPEARTQIDARAFAARGDFRDEWWSSAARGDLIAIGNHSWDHTHTAVDRVAQRNQQKGTFLGVDTYADANAQLRMAEEYIDRVTGGRSCRMFAYPYGEATDYLATEYLPQFEREHRLRAAFTIAADYATRSTSRWRIPRFSFGEHWRSPRELERILLGVTRSA